MLPKLTEEQIKCSGYINDVQLMSECWMRDFSYEEYVNWATQTNKYVHTQEVYDQHCKSCEEQMAEYMKPDA